jgi:hypothetical protein
VRGADRDFRGDERDRAGVCEPSHITLVTESLRGGTSFVHRLTSRHPEICRSDGTVAALKRSRASMRN